MLKNVMVFIGGVVLGSYIMHNHLYRMITDEIIKRHESEDKTEDTEKTEE